jgi:hypothetical protein
MIEQIKSWVDHKDLCEFFDIDPTKNLADLELIYRPDAGQWLLVGKTYDNDEDLAKILES